MAKITSLSIKGYRSIRDTVEITFPENAPVVLVGENNAGKSNIVKALEIVLREMWPGSREPEDHDFWNRDSQNGYIEIISKFSDFTFNGRAINSFTWSFDPDALADKLQFRAQTSAGTQYIKNEMRENCICVCIAADRKLSYQLSYATKFTLLSKLMKKFHNKLMTEPSRVERLKTKFDEIVDIFKEVDEFTDFQGNLQSEFINSLQGMRYALNIDFSAYDPSNYYHSLKVFPHEESQTRTFDEIGTGQEQILALAFAHAYALTFPP